MTAGEPDTGTFVRLYYPSIFPVNETINKASIYLTTTKFSPVSVRSSLSSVYWVVVYKILRKIMKTSFNRLRSIYALNFQNMNIWVWQFSNVFLTKLFRWIFFVHKLADWLFFWKFLLKVPLLWSNVVVVYSMNCGLCGLRTNIWWVSSSSCR